MIVSGEGTRSVRSLNQVCLKYGDGYRAKNDELATSGLPFARAGNIKDGFQFADADRFPEENLQRIGNKVSKSGDVVFTSKGTVGRFAFVREDTPRFVYSPQLCFWRSRDHELIDPRFLFYWMSGREFFVQFKGVAGQTDMAEYVSLRDQRSMQLTLPPLPEQRAIAHILGTLDDKIELNRRMNETLEAMARALFKSWFVDFDPVRAKAALRNATPPRGGSDWSVERARAYLDSMDPEIAALFPDRFVDSELGEIPAGWKVERFDGHISAQRGLSYKGAGLCGQDEGMPMHSLNSIFEGGGYKHDGIKYYKGEYRKKHVLKPGDLIVTNTEQGFDRLLIGHAAIVPETFGPAGLYSHHIYRIEIRSRSHLTPNYLCQLLNDPQWHSRISGFSNGTTINMLPMDAFEISLLVIPPAELVDAFTTLDRNALTTPKAPQPAKPKRRRGRPRKGEERPTEPRRLERQRNMTLPEMLADLPYACDIGVKRDAKGYQTSWSGYKLHIDAADGAIPVSCLLTSASLHDSQVAIPLATLTAERVRNLYDLMDSAYDAPEIRAHSRALGHVAIIDVNPRSGARKQALRQERQARRACGLVLSEERRYHERSTVERVNGRLKDEFGGRSVRVRGHAKVLCHLMFGIVALTVDQLMRLVT